jgi:hypothetical protein
MEQATDAGPQANSAIVVAGAAHEKRGGLFRSCAALALFLLCVLNWLSVRPLVTDPNQMGAQDFSIFYMGSKVLLNDQPSHLYDLNVQARYHTAPYRQHPLPYDHPAYELILFLPLSLMSFTHAYWLWVAINAALTLIISLLLSPHVPHFPRPAAAWTFAAAMASFPLLWTLCQGQDSILLLLIFTLVFLKLKSGSDRAAGLILAAGLFKFTLIVPFVAAFLIRRRWKFLAGFAVGAAGVAGLSVLMTGFAGARQYVQLLSLLASHPQVGYINLVFMPDVRGFLLALLMGHGVRRVEFEVISSILSALLLAVPSLAFHGREHAERFDLWFGLNLTIALMVSPHLYWHDLSVLLLAVFLAANVLWGAELVDGLTWTFALAWAAAYGFAWPIRQTWFKVYPSVFFLALGVFAIWLIMKVRAILPQSFPEETPSLPST